jgi:zinc protease
MNRPLDRSQLPAPGAARPVEVDDPITFTLDNGMAVVLVPDHRLPLVTMQYRADVLPTAFGERAGLPDLFGELLTAGTTRRDKRTIEDQVDAMGAVLNANAEGVYAMGLREHAAVLLELLAEVVTRPAFPQEEFQSTMRRVRSAVAQRARDPEALAEVLGRRTLFGADHPYGEVITAATLERLRAEDLGQWHAHVFRPTTGTLVLVGDLTEADARALAATHFGGWTVAGPWADWPAHLPVLERPVVAGDAPRVHVVDRPGAEQSVLRVGFPLDLHPANAQALAVRVMNTILGGGIFSARLMMRLREERGWTYGAYSVLDVDRSNSSLHVHVSVRTAVTGAAVREILEVMADMAREPVKATELDLARSHLAGAFGRSLEDARTLAQFALNIRRYGLPPDHYRTYLQRLQCITAEDVWNAARGFLFPDRAAVLVVGDADAVAPDLEVSGVPVQRMDPDGVLID